MAPKCRRTPRIGTFSAVVLGGPRITARAHSFCLMCGRRSSLKVGSGRDAAASLLGMSEVMASGLRPQVIHAQMGQAPLTWTGALAAGDIR